MSTQEHEEQNPPEYQVPKLAGEEMEVTETNPVTGKTQEKAEEKTEEEQKNG